MKRLEMYTNAGMSPARRASWDSVARLRTSACATWLPVGHADVFAARPGPWEVPI